MSNIRSTMYIEDLVGSKIVTAEGKHLGRVVDVLVRDGSEYEVTGVIFGTSAWLYRYHVIQPFTRVFGAYLKPHIVPWEDVERFEHFVVTLKPGSKPKLLSNDHDEAEQSSTSTKSSP